MTDQDDWLAKQFEAHRTHLMAVASRMLGSRSEADDAVQEAWLRLSRSDASSVENLGGWLTTVVARVCLNMLRARQSRREESLETEGLAPVTSDADCINPEQDALLAASIGPALLIVLEALSPAERVAFVLHDMFGVPFEEIAATLGRSPDAARQLASRGRRRVQGAGVVSGADVSRQREVVNAFLAASRQGEFDALLALLDPDVVLHADSAGVRMGASSEVRGAPAVAETFFRRAQAAQPALLDGAVGLLWAQHGRPRVAFLFTISGRRVVSIELVADTDRLRQLDLVVLND